MKITKSQIQKIIREEIKKLLEYDDSKGKKLQVGDTVKVIKSGKTPATKRGVTASVVELGQQGLIYILTDKDLQSVLKFPLIPKGNYQLPAKVYSWPIPADQTIKTGQDRQLFRKIEKTSDKGFKKVGAKKQLSEAKRETLVISKYDQNRVKKILDKLRLKSGREYDFGVGQGTTFLLDIDDRYFDKALEAFIRADVKVSTKR